MTKSSFRRRAQAGRLLISFAASTASLSLQAQPTPATDPTQRLGEVTVTGNPLGGPTPMAPVGSLSGTPLLLRSQSTLGETLNSEPGVSSSYFGPHSSRPIVRGLEGDRIRILQNGMGMHDVSGLSPDHAVSLDPMSVERIEVLRGPGALLYGGSAVGGVVNVIDNRIARQPQFGAQGGVGGQVGVSAASGANGRAGSILLEGGNHRMQWHLDAFDRRSGDVRAPVVLPCNKNDTPTQRRRLCNSASESEGGAVGVSWFGSDGYVGASLSSYRSRYGVVAEDDVTVGMRSNRYALEGERRGLGGPLRSLRWSLGHTDYAHTEFKGSEAETRFATRGSDLRVQARPQPFGAWDTVIGLQADATRFSAAGEEAYAPSSRTEQTAGFVYGERGLARGKLSAGARIESVRVRSLGDGADGRFAPAGLDFAPWSLALGAQHPLGSGWQIGSNVAYTERAPRDYELFANGPHAATAAYEVGSTALAKEKSWNVDLGARWRSAVGVDRLAASVYMNRFSNYIGLAPTGAQQDGLDEFRYRQTAALFRGLEVSGLKRLHSGGGALDLNWRADLVRASDRVTGEPLPRIPPWRAGAALTWTQAAWSASLGADHAEAQRRVPAVADGQRPGATSAYTLWHATASYRQRAGAASLLWYARLDNLTDQLAYSATSVLTTTAPGRVPLPGRSLRVGLRASF